MQNCKVSILVAVYNAEKYLRQCLDSLCRQSLRDIQIICIDDASTDDSPRILNEYQTKDDRVELIRSSRNRGQAHARNLGLRQARGQYICFLDSDDWMAPDALEKAVDTFESHPQTDSVLFHTIYYYAEDRQEQYAMPPFEVLKGEDAFVKSLTWQIHGVYMVRADIHSRYPYDESAHAFSDDNTTRLHYLASREVRQCDGVYYYRQHSASTSHKVSPYRFDYLIANRSMKRQLIEIGVSDEILTIYENHRWLNVVDLYMFYHFHRRQLLPADAAQGFRQIKAAWQTIETNRLRPSLRGKFGYMPLHFSWALFRLQEECYFTLRKLIKGK